MYTAYRMYGQIGHMVNTLMVPTGSHIINVIGYKGSVAQNVLVPRASKV